MGPASATRRRHGAVADADVDGTPTASSRHRRLHEPRAGARARRRQAHRYLGVRLRALRDADRAARRSRGETVSDTLAAILEREPDWSALPRATPAARRALLRRCLEKDPKRRLRDIADARIEIEEAKIKRGRGSASRRGRCALENRDCRGDRRRGPSPQRLHGCCRAASRRSRGRIRTSVTLPADVVLDTGGDHSVDRRVARWPPARVRRHERRPNASLSAQPRRVRRESDRRHRRRAYPFFSPDGKWLAFFTSRQLKRVSIAGGAPVLICDVATVGRGATWGPDGNIVFAAFDAGLMRVNADGGEPTPLATLDPELDSRLHIWPQYLPDGSGLLSTIDRGTLIVLSFATRHWHELCPDRRAPYLEPGTSCSTRFKLARDKSMPSLRPPQPRRPRLAGRGARRRVPQRGHRRGVPRRRARRARGVRPRRLLANAGSSDRQGRRSPLVEERRGFRFPRVVARRTALAVTVDPRPSQIWVYDLQRGTGIPLTSEGSNIDPTWTRDGQRVAF